MDPIRELAEAADPSAAEAIAALDRLAVLGRRPPPDPTHIDHVLQKTKPSAAVLVPLFIGRSNTLYVLLSRRSNHLRGYPGDTALPGGKVEAGDVTFEDTARREAHEEIGLVRDPSKVVFLTQGPNELSREGMVVTPIIVWVKDTTLIPELNPDEVAEIFALPLANFLTSVSPYPPAPASAPAVDASAAGAKAGKPPKPYYSFFDADFVDRRYRRHQFLTNREASGIQPVRGLTAAILINTATAAFGRPPDFQRYADPKAPGAINAGAGGQPRSAASRAKL